MRLFNKQRDIVAILIIFILFLKFFEPSFVRKISNLNYDTYQTLFLQNFDRQDIRIIDIDDKSIKEIGQFPWRRDKLAKIIDNLNKANPKVIAFDIFFSEPDRENPSKILDELLINSEDVLNSDEEFLKSINNSKVVLPIVGLGAQQESEENLNDNIKAKFIFKGQAAINSLYKFSNGLTSLKTINDKAKGVGSISIIDSEDGVLRYVPLLVGINNQVWPALSLETLRIANNQKNFLVASDELGIQTIKTRTDQFFTNENALIYLKYKNFNQEHYISAVDILMKILMKMKLKIK